MTNSLADTFTKHLQAQSGVAPDIFLVLRAGQIKSALDWIEHTPDAKKLRDQVKNIVKVSNWLLDPIKYQEFVQLVGEAQFWMMAEEKGVKLKPIPETSAKTPDFQFDGPLHGPDLQDREIPRFEVKTLSVKDGDRNILVMQESSYEAQLDISRQQREGRSIAFGLSQAAPHGAVPDGKAATTVIRNLIDKTRNNVKEGQYETAPTFLVVNLMLIDGHCQGEEGLRPVVVRRGKDWEYASGPYWNLAFGKNGHLVFGVPEFEGKPAVEGELDREGILLAFPFIAALFLIVHSMSSTPKIYGLRRVADEDSWTFEQPLLAELFHAISDYWNDDVDTNGFALVRSSKRDSVTS